MGKPTGFVEWRRLVPKKRGVAERLRDWREVEHASHGPLEADALRAQAGRCMDCGVPFCTSGCPLGNPIPDFADLTWRDRPRDAYRRLAVTNDFPEFTGRLCPAPCEGSCVLGIGATLDGPVTIEALEKLIVERAFAEGWVTPAPRRAPTGRRIAIVGSGPAGLACAQQLARAGHATTVFERSDRVGGLLRYGIPDFKMEKHLIDRRVRQMESEGVIFRTGFEVGSMVTVQRLLDDYDVLVMACGAEDPRDLPVPGRELDGVHYAMEFLTQQNKRNAGDDEATAAPNGTLSAKGKHVVVIGGGDTGSDCIGTSNRQGAASVTQLEIMPAPPEHEDKALTWPDWPLKMRTSSSQAEGVERDFAVVTKQAIGKGGKVAALECARVEWVDGRMREVEGSGFELKADLVLLAMGFVGPRKAGVVAQSGVALDPRGNVKASVADYRTSDGRIFACGDARRGQSLVVWAIREGRQCARAVDEHLMGVSTLPR
ncbi:MAG: glutamate synthase subunit beta [Phenylobacterium sp.]|nr:glutamate synthase subunit beta [Phenylobacterium sp.]